MPPTPKADPAEARARAVAGLLKLAADPIRVSILAILAAAGERNVLELMADIGINQAAVSHHLRPLFLAGLVEQTRRGRNHFYSLTESGSRLAEVICDVIAHVEAANS